MTNINIFALLHLTINIIVIIKYYYSKILC